MPVYLLHFDSPMAHAQHYTGFAKKDALERIKQHASASCDVKIINEFKKRGIGFVVAKIWKDKDQRFERYLKKKHKQPRRLCPVCIREKEN